MSAATTKKLSTTLLRSILVYSVVILLSFSAAFSAFFYFTYEQDEESRIAGIVQNAARTLDNEDLHNEIVVLDSQLQEGLRYTLVGEDGEVLYDSSGEASGNHADRPEVVDARRLGASSVTRYSSTLGEDTVYAAVLLKSGNVLRVSEQRASFLSVLESTLPALVPALLVALLLSYALSRLLTNRAVSPFENIDVAHPLDNSAYDEMRPLLERIELQRRQLMDQNNELARAEDLRREFSANVSHEMKTPLQVISGYAELLALGNVSEDDARKFARLIQAESKSMTSLIDDVLALSRLDDPVMENAGKEKMELLSFAHGVTARLTPYAKSKDVNLRCLGSTVEIDANKGLVDQLLSNLITNAVNYSCHGGDVVVTIGKNLPLPGSDGYPQAVIKVKDSGCGIPSEEIDKIFERFYRVDKSRSKESGGTGLGLAIAKHAASFHDATIEVESQLGKGSVFTVLFPLE